MEPERITYLQMIQSNIERMSTTSAVFKGFCATVVVGMAAVSFTAISKWVLLLSFLPVLCFFSLDAYYFILEKKCRFMFEQVRTKKKSADFDMKIELTKEECIAGNATFLNCLKSPSIYLFYVPIVTICIAIIVFKFKGGI